MTGGNWRAVAGRMTHGANAMWLALALYAAITGFGVLNDGYHSDDWRHLGGASRLWTPVEGRWLLEVIYRDLLGERFLLPVQLILAFPCLYWVAHILSRHAANEATAGPAALLIFAIGTQHVFMTDVLSFGSNVFAYPLALALSVAGYELIWRASGQAVGRQVIIVALSAQLLAFSVAIYQTFAVAGLIVPLLVLMRIDRVSFGAALRLAGIGAFASVLALAIYLLEWRLYAAATGVTIVSERFQATGAGGLIAKLHALPGLLRSLHTGSLMALPFVLRAALGLFSLAALALLVLAGLGGLTRSAGSRSSALLGPVRLVIGAALAFFVFPVMFWLGYEGDSPPPRAFGYLGFWIAAAFILGLTLASAGLRSRWRTLFGALAWGAAGLVTLVLTFASAMIWSDSARVGGRDSDLARAIYARLSALPGYTGPPFRIVGTVDHADLSWGTLAGWSVFHAGNPNMGIFQGLFGLDEPVSDLPVSPRACHAFPAEDAAFLHEGMAYLCLEDFEPYPATLACANLGAPGAGRLCLGPTTFVHIGPACLETGPDAPELRVAFRRAGGGHAPDRSFSVASFAIPMGPDCHTIALAPAQRGLETLVVRMIGPEGTTVWQQDIPVTSLRPALQ